jgi:hypothetical protein
MWGKLQKANLIKPVRFSDDNLFLARKHEAEEMKFWGRSQVLKFGMRLKF